MSTSFYLPSDKETLGVLSMLYGDDIQVAKDDEDSIAIENSELYGLYVDPEGKPVAVCLCDTPFAAYAGAALSMLPPGGAEDAAESGDISATMKENVYEVMNICSRLLMSDDTPHLKLEKMYNNLSELSEEAVEMMKSAGGSSHFGIDIPNYGKGRLSLVTT
jgi:hypothetical protein